MAFDFLNDFSTNISRELFRLVVGDWIGSGEGRDVHEFLPNKDYVIKLENKAMSFQNICEWETWREAKDIPKLSKFFSPCIYISPCGLWLVQMKVKKIEKEEYPTRVPKFFTDLKYGNYGLLDKKFVCCDYGNFSLTKGMDTKLKKADWWE